MYLMKQEDYTLKSGISSQENAHYGIKDLKTIRPRSTYIEFENRIRQQEDTDNTEESTEPTSLTPSEN